MDVKTGDIVYGIVTKIVGYGAFVVVDDYNGLIHISEFSDGYVRSIHDYVHIGEKVKLRVVEVEEKYKRLKLSYKSLNKTRGIKCEVPHYQVGFKTLRDHLPQFIQDQLKGEANE